MEEKKDGDALQFYKGEFDSAAQPLACTICQAPLTQSYFTANLQPCCAACADKLKSGLNRKPTLNDVVRSVVYGTGAGILGSIIYYLILKVTGYEIGLIAILVGFLVGKAVMAGSGNRGGLRYRVIAVAITYIAIVSTYVPLIIEALRQHQTQQKYEAGPKLGVGVPSITPSVTAPQPETKPVPPKEKAPKAGPEQTDQAVAENSPPPFLALLALLGLILSLPFLGGFENIIGILIILFALFEAARRTKKPQIEFAGPFEIGQDKTETEPHA